MMTNPTPRPTIAAHESSALTYSDSDSIAARQQLFGLLESYQATPEEKERSLGLFLRGSLLARILAIADLYRQIVDIPGSVFDIGTWRGQTAVLCENLRAVYEPLHFTRRIVCFDTFEGYAGFSVSDNTSAAHNEGTYAVGGDYAQFLSELLVLHERCNAMGQNHGKHSVIKGDCRETLPGFFAAHPNEFVALAFFDVNAYDPTQQALAQVWDRLVPGGIVAFWQLTRSQIVAEGQAYVEQFLRGCPHTLHRAATYPGLCYVRKT